MKKNWLYLIPLFVTLYLSELFNPAEDNMAYTKVLIDAQKIVPFIALLYILLNIHKLKPLYLFFFAMPMLYFTYLVFESVYFYKSLIQFPHVFLKIMQLFMAFAAYIFYRKHHETNLTMVMNVIMIMLFVRILLDPSIISVTAFVTHDRALHAPSIYLLLVPCLYFFNVYIVEFDNKALIKFLILFFFIIYFQHRTVWVATSVSFLFNFFVLKRQNMLPLKKTIPTVMLLGFVFMAVASLLVSYFPEIGDKIAENIANISNPKEDTTGTAGWRMLQYESYWPYVQAHFIEGMRLAGFELPVQFYNPDAPDYAYFEDGTGHHFHSFYYDILFYFGLIGVLIFLIIMVQPIYAVLRYRLTISPRYLSLVSFSFSGLVFGVSYNTPDFYWVVFGVALAYLDISFSDFRKSKQAVDTQVHDENR